MSSGNLTGLAAIVGRSRNQEPEKTDQDTAGTNISQEVQSPAAPKPVREKTGRHQEPAPAAAKYADPERVQLKAYVRRTTKVDAVHKWQREGRGDVSDLIETLLNQYLSS